jgi:hypothetical protein
MFQIRIQIRIRSGFIWFCGINLKPDSESGSGSKNKKMTPKEWKKNKKNSWFEELDFLLGELQAHLAAWKSFVYTIVKFLILKKFEFLFMIIFRQILWIQSQIRIQRMWILNYLLTVPTLQAKPVIITDATEDWPARSWTINSLVSLHFFPSFCTFRVVIFYSNFLRIGNY